MPSVEGVQVEGLRELNRAFARLGKDANKQMRGELKKVAEPVASDAHQLAASRIRNIGPKWSEMRVGVTQRLVYVVPKQRGRLSRRNPKLKRPNMAPLLMTRAMLPALHENEQRIVQRLENLLDRLADENGF